MCNDSHIKKPSSEELKGYGYWWLDLDGVTSQHYADDIIRFSRRYDGMLKLIPVVQGFIRESNIQFNPKDEKFSRFVPILMTLFL
jgi:hypothetical protein